VDFNEIAQSIYAITRLTNMTKKQETNKSSQGQTGPELKLHFSELTDNEKKLVAALNQTGRPILTIKELVKACGWHRLRASNANEDFTGKVRGNSRVRNTLRRLVRSNWVENAEGRGRGTYRLSKKGSDRLRRAGTKPSKAKPSKAPAKEQAIAF